MSMDRTVGTGPEVDVAEIREALGQMHFPAQLDDVLATLVRVRAPARLLWRVSGLPRTQCYHCLDDLCTDVVRGFGPGAPPPGP